MTWQSESIRSPPSPMHFLVPTVFFYISGHGFGHAVRQIAIINALCDVAPSCG